MAYFRAPSEEYLSQSPHGYQDEIRLQQFGLGETYNNQRPLSNPFESDPSIKNYADISYRETQDSFESDPADGLPDPSILRHSFRQRDQILKQLGSILGRFVLSIIFCGGIVGVFYYYDSLQQMTTGHKHYFNAIHTGLLLILGLNIVSAFKEMADIFRWKILASRQKKGGFSAKEIDLIFGISSYQKCVSLMFHWMKKRPKFFFPLTLWVILGIGIQVAVAALGLTHNIDEADLKERPRNVKGDSILTTDLTNYYMGGGWTGNEEPPTFWKQNSQSQVLGISGDNTLNFEVDLLDFEEFEQDIDTVPYNETGRNSSQGLTYRYYFREAVKYDVGSVSRIRVPSTRYITVNTSCTHYQIKSGSTGYVIHNPIMVTPKPPKLVDPVNKNSSEPFDYIERCQSSSSTVYVNPIPHLNETEKYYETNKEYPEPLRTCGPRCAFVEIFRFNHYNTTDYPGDYFQCRTDISKVKEEDGSPVSDPRFELPDHVARRAASSIGADGMTVGNGAQCQRYVNATRYDWADESGPETIHLAETNVARFAISSIAMLDKTNPYIKMDGLNFGSSFQLKIKSYEIMLILAGILIAQLVTGLSVIFACRNTYCRDSGVIGTARILRGVTKKMGSYGSAATDKEIWAFYKGRRMRYGVTNLPDGTEKLDILMDKAEKTKRRSMHAGGIYA